MTKQASILWKGLRRSLAASPGRWAAGSALSDPFGLLAVERMGRAAPQRSPDDSGPGQGFPRARPAPLAGDRGCQDRSPNSTGEELPS